MFGDMLERLRQLDDKIMFGSIDRRFLRFVLRRPILVSVGMAVIYLIVALGIRAAAAS